jgi:acetyltransferase-like isoleucine patch superfamily enzyme
MNYPKIYQYQQSIKSFLLSEEKEMEFTVDCELKDRIKFIYAVIFPKGTRFLFYLRFFVSRIAYYIDYSPLKVLIYRFIGIKIGKGVFISPEVTIDVHFPKLIQIDDYVILGYGASLVSHDFFNSRYRLGRIEIERGAVIGAQSIIACGVQIGEEVNVRVRSVVLKDIKSPK